MDVGVVYCLLHKQMDTHIVDVGMCLVTFFVFFFDVYCPTY